jgi:hypothetical protein
MLGDNTSILTLHQPCADAVDWVVDQVNRAGLSVMRTFDLQVARDARMDCPCPHHGTDVCDCQMVVLLVYAGEGEPVTLIAHGYNGQTWFSVVDNPQQRADPRVEMTIRQFVSRPFASSL